MPLRALLLLAAIPLLACDAPGLSEAVALGPQGAVVTCGPEPVEACVTELEGPMRMCDAILTQCLKHAGADELVTDLCLSDDADCHGPLSRAVAACEALCPVG